MWLAIKTSPAPVILATLTVGGFADINLSSATSVTLLGPSVTITLVLQFAANALAAALEDRNVWFNMKLASSRFT